MPGATRAPARHDTPPRHTGASTPLPYAFQHSAHRCHAEAGSTPRSRLKKKKKKKKKKALRYTRRACSMPPHATAYATPMPHAVRRHATQARRSARHARRRCGESAAKTRLREAARV
jgi:hypothetical protein